jgi:ABC-2 type transport system ATP-binding protein
VNNEAIIVQNASKSFTIKNKKGFFKSLGKPKERFQALKNVSFSVKQGEILGYIGPNGAGKSTTIKLMTGILTPDSGKIEILGFTPWLQRMQYTKNIGVVFGQKGLLWWDLSPKDIFPLYKEIYEIPKEQFEERVKYLTELFEAQNLVNTPTRKLSLGERMRCEIIAALLHRPKVLFLDEPTIGLDAIAKEKMRSFIKEINEKEKTTIVLTTHDMNDIEELASRIIVLDKGMIIFEGNLEKFKKAHIKEAVMSFEVLQVKDSNALIDLLSKTKQVVQEGNYYEVAFNLEGMTAQDAATKLFNCCTTSSFQIKEPTLEEIIKDFYECR